EGTPARGRNMNASDNQEQHLEAILAGYLAAVDAGNAPSPAEVIARHPGLSEELSQFFADEARLQQMAPPRGTLIRYFGDYELLEPVGRGGMGVVYRARQVSLNRVAAVKMILDSAWASDQALQRFTAEAEAAARLDHPNIVPIYEVGTVNGQPY